MDSDKALAFMLDHSCPGSFEDDNGNCLDGTLVRSGTPENPFMKREWPKDAWEVHCFTAHCGILTIWARKLDVKWEIKKVDHSEDGC